MNKITLSALCSAITLAATSLSAQTHNEMETTIVTATRTEQSIADSLAPVTVFERADIERIQPVDLQELLSRAVGVSFVRNGGRGANTSLFLRGNQSNHTLVLIDGVRIGSATLGSPSLTNLPPELIERVEIVRGSRSSLYGSEAIGGVVNIITRKYHDTDGVKPMLQLGIGTQGSSKALAAVSGGNNQTQFNLSALQENTDGIDNSESKSGVHGDKDGFEQTAFNLTASHKINERASLFALYQNSRSESDYDTNCYGTPFAVYSCSPYSVSEVNVANIRGEFQLLQNWLLTLSAGESKDQSQIKHHYIESGAVGVSGDNFDTTRKIYSLQNDWLLSDSHVLTVGFERLLDEVDSNLNYGEDSRANKAVFAQWQADLGIVDLAIGGRNDDNEQFGHYDTRNISVGVQVAQPIKIIASYGEGFNAPTFNDLYYPFYGVATLAPETSVNRELELRGDHTRGAWSVSYFHNDVDQLIQYNPATFGPDQIKGAELKGLELSASTSLYQWNIEANATLLDATDTSTNKDLRRRASKQFNIDADRQWQHWGTSASLRFVGNRYEDTNNTDELGSYALVDSAVSYRFNEQLKLNLALKNIFDREYVTARGSLGDYQPIGREAMLSITYTPK
ncbi:vitamin B12 transporter [Zhongshania antarctica]|uniref:Vitamin B12 transporter n=1 Tax=Zhongshania antarctica TaxID=641702 RepID=A0A840R6T5_9GAMM|nr:TonB-dependent receptor [Zhongshania antarctica]MBB5188071.1 vitamin B12 transporter [Zhongshania antarctica]